MVNGGTRLAGEVRQLQEKRCRAQLREPSAQPDPRLLPKIPKPCPALAAEE